MTRARWDPACYETFRREREQPFIDLCSLLVPVPGMRIADLGCGSGRLTGELHRRLRAAETVGVDRDAAMLAEAKGGGGVSFLREDIDAFVRRREVRGAFDLVFSNAALHWLVDHERLVPQLVDMLAEGGQLAFQVPANHDHPAHLAADEVAREAPFFRALGGYERGVPVLEVRRYAELCYDLGLWPPVAQLRTYLHELSGPGDVLTWLRGSLLTAYEARLEPENFESFVARLRERLGEVLPAREPYPFTYNRILVWGRRADSAFNSP